MKPSLLLLVTHAISLYLLLLQQNVLCVIIRQAALEQSS
jgi:hypothetical protein